MGAFGKKFTLDEKQRSALKGYAAQSISITSEAGYEVLGGHTVHWKFRRHFYVGEKLVEREIVISISKGKGLKLHEGDAKPAELLER